MKPLLRTGFGGGGHHEKAARFGGGAWMLLEGTKDKALL